MRRSRLVGAAMAAVLSALPLSELYAACSSYTMLGGFELRTCSNGTCWSQSVWSDNKLVEVIDTKCDGNPPTQMPT
jgi:hypothetical protein